MALLLQQQREQEELALPGSCGADKVGVGLSHHLASPTNGHSLSLFHNEVLHSHNEVLVGDARGRGPTVSPFAGGLRARPLSLKLTGAEHTCGLAVTPPDHQLQVGLDAALGGVHAPMSLSSTTARWHGRSLPEPDHWAALTAGWLALMPPAAGAGELSCSAGLWWHGEQVAPGRGDSEPSRRCSVGPPNEPQMRPSLAGSRQGASHWHPFKLAQAGLAAALGALLQPHGCLPSLNYTGAHYI